MRVETYTDRYFLDVVKLVENFHKEAVSEYDGVFDPNAVIETIKEADKSTLFLMIVDEVAQGIIYGKCFKSFLNDGQVFQEIIWYVNKPYRSRGVKLLREAEKMLKDIGVSTMIMAVLENSKTEKLKRFYERIGYKPMETHYVRNLTSPQSTSPDPD